MRHSSSLLGDINNVNKNGLRVYFPNIMIKMKYKTLKYNFSLKLINWNCMVKALFAPCYFVFIRFAYNTLLEKICMKLKQTCGQKCETNS